MKRNKFNYKFSTFLKNNDNENNDNGTENKGHMPVNNIFSKNFIEDFITYMIYFFVFFNRQF